MDITGPEQLHHFLAELGRRCVAPAKIYIFGGSAILLIGGARHTGDVDFTIDSPQAAALREAIAKLSDDLTLDLEESIPSEFMPLPDGADERHQLIGQYGQLTAYVFDPYSIALMKIDRAFQTDMQDVRFLLDSGHIDLNYLERCVENVAQHYDEPTRLSRNFAEMKRGLAS